MRQSYLSCLRIPSIARPVAEIESVLLLRRLEARRAWLIARQQLVNEAEAARKARIAEAQRRALERWAAERPANVTRIEEARR